MPTQRRWSIRFEDWPARERRFWQDEFLAHCENVTTRHGAVLSKSTKQIQRKAFEQWLSFLVRTGRYRSGGAVADAFCPDNARAFAEEILRRKRPSSALIDLTRVASCIRIACGREAALRCQDSIRALRTLAEQTPPPPKPLRTSAELYRLGMSLMIRASPRAKRYSRGAVAFRDGLMIALLAARPIRLGNLSMMIIGKHFLYEGGMYWIHFSSTETKTGQPLHLPVPRVLTPYVGEYLTHVRPVLLRLGRKHESLWASVRSRPLSYTATYTKIATATLKAFGARISPHRFRHAAATSQALQDPTRVGDAYKLLGHSSFKSVQRFYIQTSTNDGARKLQKNLQQLRRQAQLKPEGKCR